MQRLQHHTLSFNDFTLDLTRGCLLRGDEEIKLRPKSFETLRHLVENSGRLIGKNELIADTPVPSWRKFLAQFQNVLVILLLIATAISAGLWLYERESAMPYEAWVKKLTS